MIRRLGICWGGNLRLNVRAQGFIKDELEDDDEYENEEKCENEEKNKVESDQVGLPERKDGWLRLLFLSPSSIASEAWWW